MLTDIRDHLVGWKQRIGEALGEWELTISSHEEEADYYVF